MRPKSLAKCCRPPLPRVAFKIGHTGDVGCLHARRIDGDQLRAVGREPRVALSTLLAVVKWGFDEPVFK